MEHNQRDAAERGTAPRGLSVAEAAAALGVSPATVRRRLKRGVLRAETVAGPRGPATRVFLTDAPANRDAGAEAAASAGPAPPLSEGDVIASSGAAFPEVAAPPQRAWAWALAAVVLLGVAVAVAGGALRTAPGQPTSAEPDADRVGPSGSAAAPAPPPTPARVAATSAGDAAPAAAAPAVARPVPSPEAPAGMRAPDAGATAGRLLYERFEAPPGGWPDDPRATAWFGDGAYRLFARDAGRFVAVGSPRPPVRDVVVTGTFRKAGGPPGGGYGLIVRDQGPGPRDGLNQGGRFYVFAVGDRGEVGAWRREGDRWADLLPWTGSAAVRPGKQANQLRVRAADRRFTFSVNGQQVAGLEDPDPRAGTIGVFAGGDLNEVDVLLLVAERPDEVPLGP